MTDYGVQTAPVFRLLFVCTGNICRSAAAERLAGQAFTELGDVERRVVVRSAGTRAVVGAPVHPDTAAAVSDLGGSVEGFTAQQLTAPMVREADLVLTMTRDHRRLALALDPRALSRTFTLREAADVLGEIDLTTGGAFGTPAAGGRPLGQLMAAGRAQRRSSSADDIRDPINAVPDVHRQVVEVIAQSLPPVVRTVSHYL